ncbi:MAG: energy transducer TonB [Thermonemataceae bacterium]
MTKLLLGVMAVFFFNVRSIAQDTLSVSEEVYLAVDNMPEPREGYTRFVAYVEQQIRYPQEAIDHQIEGYVFIRFVVDKNGRVIKPTILKGLGYGCDEEVLRVFKNLPPWRPGKEEGRKVAVQMTFAIIFRF